VGFSFINDPFGGAPIPGNPHMEIPIFYETPNGFPKDAAASIIPTLPIA